MSKLFPDEGDAVDGIAVAFGIALVLVLVVIGVSAVIFG